MNKKAFTLVEIIIVIIILGVLAGLALPRYVKTLEIHRSNAAEQQLKVLATTVSMFVEGKTVPDCSVCDTNDINTYFDLDIHDPDFDYTAECSSGSTSWTVTATRNSGSNVYTLEITDADPDTVTCDSTGSQCSYVGR